MLRGFCFWGGMIYCRSSLSNLTFWATPAVRKLICAILLALALADTGVSAEAISEGQDKAGWVFLVQEVARSEPAIQRVFATVVLLQLAEVHLGEAGLARRQASAETTDARERKRLFGWAVVVEGEAQRYLRLHDAAQTGAPVRVMPAAETGRQPLLSVGGRVVILSHLRPSQQAELEAFIVADFCRQVDCLSLGGGPRAGPQLAPPH
ncbi:MAG: hypothetical protein CME40_00395 [Haliea sp.]|nr:hypothetical protein [Haliea sp.]